MITNNGPVQTSIVRNLTRWEFRNLQLAGVRISVGRVFRRKYQIPIRCDECNPEEEEQLVARCTNSTQTFDEIRACSGSPFLSQGKLRENSISDQEIQDCLQTEPWWGEEDSPENGPNTDKHPIHTKVCRRCRDWYVANEMFHQVRTIAEFRTPLCKRHSLERANQSPLNACRCFNYINDKWRCSFCYGNTLHYLKSRADVFKIFLANVQIPWSHPWTYLTSLWAPREGPVCPIEGCFQPAWLDKTAERMHLCMGCDAICRI